MCTYFRLELDVICLWGVVVNRGRQTWSSLVFLKIFIILLKFQNIATVLIKYVFYKMTSYFASCSRRSSWLSGATDNPDVFLSLSNALCFLASLFSTFSWMLLACFWFLWLVCSLRTGLCEVLLQDQCMIKDVHQNIIR